MLFRTLCGWGTESHREPVHVDGAPIVRSFSQCMDGGVVLMGTQSRGEEVIIKGRAPVKNE